MTLVQAHHEWAPTDEDMAPTPHRDPIDGDTDSARVLSRVEYAARLRLQRLHWDVVARMAGYSNKGSAYNAVIGYLRRRTDETVAELREQESASLDAAAAAIWPQVEKGSARAQDTWLRNRARYAALNGLNAPLQVSLSSGAAAMMHDALTELEDLVMGAVVSRTDEPLELGDDGA